MAAGYATMAMLPNDPLDFPCFMAAIGTMYFLEDSFIVAQVSTAIDNIPDFTAKVVHIDFAVVVVGHIGFASSPAIK